MDALAEKVCAFAERNAPLPLPGRVLVAVSGGADSMALLSLLCRWPQPGLTVAAVHVHHGIRGAEADRDAAFVAEMCRAWKVPLFSVRADVPGIAARERLGLEETGRLVRYAVFARVAQMWRADVVATAHTASDQAETVLMHLLRGCGIAGLAGIPAVRGRLVRPLLSCTRTEIEAYCRRLGIPYVTDSTNVDVRYTRNAVRYDLLPAMRRLNPAAEQALLRIADSAAEDEAYLSRVAQEALTRARLPEGLDGRQIADAPPSIGYRMLRQSLAAVGCRSMERRHFEEFLRLLAQGDGAVCLPGGWRLTVAGGCVRIDRPADALPDLPDTLPISALPFGGTWDGRPFCVRLVNAPDMETAKNVHRMFFKFAVDYDRIQNDLSVRTVRPGDRLHPAGRGVGKSVRRLMQENGLPPAQRERFPLLCDGAGVLLLPGMTCADRARLTESAKHFLVWEWTGEPS